MTKKETGQYVLPIVKAYFDNPQNRKEFELWKKAKTKT